jgi:hypothetical protein
VRTFARWNIYLNSQHPASDDPARRFAETLGQVRLIRSLDFDSIWAGEHHATPGFHYFPQQALLHRIAAEAEGLWIGTNVTLLPFHMHRAVLLSALRIIIQVWTLMAQRTAFTTLRNSMMLRSSMRLTMRP